jgi:hypothetical protein
MSQPDIIGVNASWFNVTLLESMNDPALRRKTLQRLDVMRREAEHAIRAIDVMRHELRAERPFPSTRLASALKQSRDWVLSLVISEAYVIAMNLNFVLRLLIPTLGFYSAAPSKQESSRQDPILIVGRGFTTIPTRIPLVAKTGCPLMRACARICSA